MDMGILCAGFGACFAMSLVALVLAVKALHR